MFNQVGSSSIGIVGSTQLTTSGVFELTKKCFHCTARESHWTDKVVWVFFKKIRCKALESIYANT